MTAQQELQNKRIALASTVGIFAVLFVLMFFIIIWSPGNPPAFGGSGVEVAFGTTDVGYGDFDPAVAGDNSTQEQAPAKNEEQPEPVPQQQASAQQTPEESDEALEDVKSEEESPIAATPPKKEKEVVKEPAKVKETPKKVEPQPKKEEPKTNPATVYNPNGKSTSSTDAKATGDGKKGEAGNQGDQPGTKGDMGNPKGKLDDTGIYKGNPGQGGDGPGGAGGVGLEMTGWTWEVKPKVPELTEQNGGFVIFEITVDDQGEIINTKVIENNLSTAAMKQCEAKIRDVSFRHTGNGAAPPQSKGRIRFNVIAR
ncbi:hypothetical protein [Pseudochryseolinea flava]|uniref:Energy transducer TonB n=1 Tax=Pseudochryseolinea flava TaxID=2059302 RepID=A0A364XV04_9BACT|nr:hypothetical protein [Pseudochryseolinea flava]RAV97998.1 hypothetical protein DQQ10_25685 [Pseudochryseolinea flava]